MKPPKEGKTHNSAVFRGHPNRGWMIEFTELAKSNFYLLISNKAM